MRATLEATGRMANWETATLYHLVHAVAMLAVALQPEVRRWPVILFGSGIVIFSGSLYVLALTNLKWLGAITPIGGLCLLGGWLVLLIKPRA